MTTLPRKPDETELARREDSHPAVRALVSGLVLALFLGLLGGGWLMGNGWLLRAAIVVQVMGFAAAVYVLRKVAMTRRRLRAAQEESLGEGREPPQMEMLQPRTPGVLLGPLPVETEELLLALAEFEAGNFLRSRARLNELGVPTGRVGRRIASVLYPLLQLRLPDSMGTPRDDTRLLADRSGLERGLDVLLRLQGARTVDEIVMLQEKEAIQSQVATAYPLLSWIVTLRGLQAAGGSIGDVRLAALPTEKRRALERFFPSLEPGASGGPFRHGK